MKLEDMKGAIRERWEKPIVDYTQDDGHDVYSTYAGLIIANFEERDGAIDDIAWDIFRGLWEEARDMGDFLKRVRKNRELQFISPAWWLMCEVEGWDEPEGFRTAFVQLYTGDLKLGDFRGTVVFYVPVFNPGTTPLVICDSPGAVDADRFGTPVACAGGLVQIYDTDALGFIQNFTPDLYLNGNYTVYVKDGVVLFMRSEELE